MTTFLFFFGPRPEFPGLCVPGFEVPGIYGRQMRPSERKTLTDLLRSYQVDVPAAEVWVLGPEDGEYGDALFSCVIEEINVYGKSTSDMLLERIIRGYAQHGRAVAVVTPSGLQMTHGLKQFADLDGFIRYVIAQAADNRPANAIFVASTSGPCVTQTAPPPVPG